MILCTIKNSRGCHTFDIIFQLTKLLLTLIIPHTRAKSYKNNLIVFCRLSFIPKIIDFIQLILNADMNILPKTLYLSLFGSILAQMYTWAIKVMYLMQGNAYYASIFVYT